MQASKDSLWVEIRVAESDEQIERAVETVHSAHRHGVISDSIAQILARIAAERSRQLSTTDRRGSVKQHDHTTADDGSVLQKVKVLLDGESASVEPDGSQIIQSEADTGPVCGHSESWVKIGGQRVCSVCHPNPSARREV